MSWGLTALILIRLDVREGEWISVQELAEHAQCDVKAVQNECVQLDAEGLLQVRLDETSREVLAARTPGSLLRAGAAPEEQPA